jgi:hypothetical protein
MPHFNWWEDESAEKNGRRRRQNYQPAEKERHALRGIIIFLAYLSIYLPRKKGNGWKLQ